MQWRKALLLPLTICCFPHADAGGLFSIPAQEITQIFNHIQLALSYVRQAEQVYNQTQMIRMMTREGMNLSLIPNLAGLVTSDIRSIRNLVQATQGLSYGLAANDQLFRQTYQSYTSPGLPFSTKYQNWATTTMNTALSLAKMAGFQQDSLMNEQAFNAQLQAMMSTPQGTDQILEKANVLTFAMLRQMQNLRSILSSDIQSKSAYTGYQVAKDQAMIQSAQQANVFVDREVDHSQFGYVPGQP